MPNISILNQEIRTMDGLFSLNDLHKASGANESHRPSNFIRTDQTKALIAEIERENSQSSNMSFQETAIKSVKGGKYAGTYGCHEIIYAYAMWISSAFYLKVIRYFHAGQQAEQPTLSDTLTPDQAGHIYNFIHDSSRGVPKWERPKYFSNAWGSIKHKFGVSTYKDVKARDYPTLCEFVGLTPKPELLEGELLPREDTPKLPELPKGHVNIPFNMEKNADYMVRVREGKASRKQLLYCLNPQDEKQDWWLEA